ncbi:MAG: serine hydrolase [bacterium]|nr:serine hydrolase [bacterium]
MIRNKKFLQTPVILIVLLAVLPLIVPLYSHAADEEMKGPIDYTKIDEQVRQLMEDGNIPGLTLVVIDGEKAPYIKGYGFADMEKEVKVTEDTLFELGSTSKAFTALAALQLEQKGTINLDANVSEYLEGFHLIYEGERVEVTVRQILHQTGGIPVSAITELSRGGEDTALQDTVKKLSGMKIDREPGKQYEYSTVNYDIAGAIIEKMSGVSFEEYMVENIFKPLGMSSTIVGADQFNPPAGMSRGHKIGFFKPRLYLAPQYRDNNPAGYIISSGNDIARWLKFHSGKEQAPTLTPLMKRSHVANFPEEAVAQMPPYAMGWFINQYGRGSIFHGGANPNFTSYFEFNEEDQRAVAVLANSNSAYTGYIGGLVFNRLYGQGIGNPPDADMDKSFSVVTFMVGLFLLAILLFFGTIVWEVVKGRRQFEGLTFRKLANFVGALLMYLPFLGGIYMLPMAMQNVDWDMALVWGPTSFQATITLILAAMALSYLGFIVSSFFPQKNKYLRSIPVVIVLSLLTGGANAVVIFLVTSSIFLPDQAVWDMVYYFGLAFVLYIAGRKVVQTKLIKLTLEIVYDMRMQLIGKVFFTSFQKFEKIEEGRVLATMNNDTGQIGASAGIFVGLISSIITTMGVFIYLATIAFWATVVTILVIAFIAVLYYIVGQQAAAFLEEARETQNKYLGLLNGLVAGFKELSLHLKKKFNYKEDLEVNCAEARDKGTMAQIKLINAFLVGEALLVVVLGAVGFGVPRIFPDIQNVTLMSFIIALLYLIGPINMILAAIPGLLQINIAWGRVQTFLKEIPATMTEEDVKKPLPVAKEDVKSLNACGIFFEYKNETPEPEEGEEAPALAEGDGTGEAALVEEDAEEEPTFAVGPIDLEANRGELIFIIGGNGSGKTTLAKMMTGLYLSDEGSVKINDVVVPDYQLGEYFSVVFGDFHLFDKLYEINIESDDDEDITQKYLKMLEMDHKVEVIDNEFSTIDLSGGQRKRLALMQCYLEDAPIYLFDEVAADQDPQFRKFFYRELLTRMKEEGKIVIAITHDDHYFDVADRVIKLDMGKIDHVKDHTKLNLSK